MFKARKKGMNNGYLKNLFNLLSVFTGESVITSVSIYYML